MSTTIDPQLDAALDFIIKGIAAWQQLPYDPDKVEIDSVITPAEAKARLTAIVEAHQDQLYRQIMEAVGEDEPMTKTNAHIDIEREGKNKLRSHIRTVFKKGGTE